MGRVCLIVGLLLVLAFLVMAPSCGVGCGCGCGHVVEVRGRLVDEGRVPLADHALLGLDRFADPRDPGAPCTLAAWAEAARAGRTTRAELWAVFPGDGAILPADAFVLTERDGTFRFRIRDWECVEHSCGDPLGDTPLSSIGGLRGLLVEAASGTPPRVVAPLPPGRWTSWPVSPGSGEPGFLLELGDIVVPRRDTIR